MNVVAILGWIAVSPGGRDPFGKALGADFTSFWAASRLALGQAPAKAYNLAAHAQAQNRAFDGAPVPYAAFFYPPTYLLLCLPLGALPYLGALAAWLGATGYVCWRSICAILEPAFKSWRSLMLAFPGVLLTLGHGQNAFLTTALFAIAVLNWDCRPVLAGVCFGLLTVKPQLGLMIPLALAATLRWRVMASACATALVLAALSVAVFGPAVWQAFFAAAPLARRALEENWVGAEKMQSAFAAVRLWRGGLSLAYGVHTAVAVAAAVIMVATLRRERLSTAPDGLAQGAVLATATLLASPFLLDYDLMLLAIPLAWLAREIWRTGARSWEKAALFAVFVLPLIARLCAGRLHLPLTPPLVFALLVLVSRRAASTQAGA